MKWHKSNQIDLSFLTYIVLFLPAFSVSVELQPANLTLCLLFLLFLPRRNRNRRWRFSSDTIQSQCLNQQVVLSYCNAYSLVMSALGRMHHRTRQGWSIECLVRGETPRSINRIKKLGQPNGIPMQAQRAWCVTALVNKGCTEDGGPGLNYISLRFAEFRLDPNNFSLISERNNFLLII